MSEGSSASLRDCPEEVLAPERRRASVVVHHFGPDPLEVGGMGSVIRVLVEHNLGAARAQGHPTWRQSSRVASARLTARGIRTLLDTPRRHIVHVHLSERGSFVREGALLALAARRRMATVASIHGAEFLDFASEWPRLAASVLRPARVITCLDEQVLACVRELVPSGVAELLPNPVEMDELAPSAADTAEIVLFAGEIGLRKGADVLARAWREVARERPRARCVMAGPAGDFEVPAIERLTLCGAVDARRMLELRRRARVVVLPSRAEGMPMVLTEAMSAGRPFVSTPVGGIPDLARSGGLLVPVGDEIALAESLTRLLADPHLARQIGERGRSFCRATRSVRALDRRIERMYELASAAA